MDSHLIYTASDSLKYKVDWIKATPESEWFYFGAGKEANIEFAMKTVTEYFNYDILHIAHTRKDSQTTNKKEFLNAVENILGVENFFVWDSGFKKVIEFNNIGVMRKGNLGIE